MSIIERVAKAVVVTAATKLLNNLQNDHRGVNKVTQLTKENGWNIYEQDGNSTILQLTDQNGNARKLLINSSQSGQIAYFFTFSSHFLHLRDVPPSVMGLALVRNSKIDTGAWQIEKGEGGQAIFGLKYCAYLEAVNPGMFMLLCESLVAEAIAFDNQIVSLNLID